MSNALAYNVRQLRSVLVSFIVYAVDIFCCHTSTDNFNASGWPRQMFVSKAGAYYIEAPLCSTLG